MTEALSLLSAVLLALPAGLNPYLPLVVVSVMARYSDRFHLEAAYGFLGQTWLLVAATLLFLVNIFADKVFLPGDSLSVPAAQRDRRGWAGAIHDLSQMVLGLLSGALLMGAAERVFPSSWPLLALMLGALLAALAYAGKRTLRHRLAGRFGPLTNLLLSTLEDSVVLLVSVAGVLLHALAVG